MQLLAISFKNMPLLHKFSEKSINRGHDYNAVKCLIFRDDRQKITIIVCCERHGQVHKHTCMYVFPNSLACTVESTARTVYTEIFVSIVWRNGITLFQNNVLKKLELPIGVFVFMVQKSRITEYSISK